MKIISVILLAAVLAASGCIGQVSLPGIDSNYCTVDDDCACGVHVVSEDCFFGNKEFVNEEVQCPDFCSGIDGNLGISCENQKCVQKRVER